MSLAGAGAYQKGARASPGLGGWTAEHRPLLLAGFSDRLKPAAAGVPTDKGSLETLLALVGCGLQVRPGPQWRWHTQQEQQRHTVLSLALQGTGSALL